MKYFVIVVISVGVFGIRDPTNLRIVRGQTAGKGQFPYQVMVLLKNKFQCSGTIINQLHILTAAHCIIGVPSALLKIVAGTNCILEGGMWYDVLGYTVHEKYNDSLTSNDIAIIKLKNEMQYSDVIKQVSLNNQIIEVAADAIVSGWGATKRKGNASLTLNWVQLKIMDLQLCKKLIKGFKYPILDTNICGLNKIGKGACRGDSGGPLLVRELQVGILSFTFKCGGYFPDVYTNVTHYLSWINSNT
ncbi:hypothetical protein FQA39_LY07986 [Lamprigera yunnana]|nr:hypothetical protein FQA39_LY07986 [Lamprigera yunnana]